MICISRFLIPMTNRPQQAEHVKGLEIRYTGTISTKTENRPAQARRSHIIVLMCLFVGGENSKNICAHAANCIFAISAVVYAMQLQIIA